MPKPTRWTAQDEQVLDDLVVSVEASDGFLGLFVAVCDDQEFQAEVIGRYEAELGPEIRAYRLLLPRQDASLRRLLYQLVDSEPYLQDGGRAVLTATGADRLLPLRLGEDRSAQEEFFGYLQWTREGFRDFPYPIILWVTNQIFKELIQKAPDFWSWCKDVFRFRGSDRPPMARVVNIGSHIGDLMGSPSAQIIQLGDLMGSHSVQTRKFHMDKLRLHGFEESTPVNYLVKLTDAKEKSDPTGLVLIDLHAQLGRAYRQVAKNAQQLELAVEAFQKSRDRHEKILGKHNLGYAERLDDLADTQRLLKSYTEAGELYQQSLTIRQELVGPDHPDIATSLSNLAALYGETQRYTEAEGLYQRSLAIRQAKLGADHPVTAFTLHNLAGLYQDMGRLLEAEPLYEQALIILEQAMGPESDRTKIVRHNLKQVRAVLKAQEF
jgi:tetratricopeptide (TPR) repeat protein